MSDLDRLRRGVMSYQELEAVAEELTKLKQIAELAACVMEYPEFDRLRGLGGNVDELTALLASLSSGKGGAG